MGAPEDPIALLRRRYAAGELSTEEFRESLKAIEETQR
ncbi:MAG: SHOCT domain-containing protein [Thermoleophilia bacterium]|nr:SHOCT domain-containing protein [Thermoleophilia bacterium]